MALVLNGSGTITGLTSGGLPDGSITSDDLAGTLSFHASQSANQSITNNTATKVSLDTSDWDTNSAFDETTNYRFTVPSGMGGKYLFSYSGYVQNIDNAEFNMLMLYKNGVQYDPSVRKVKIGANVNDHSIFMGSSIIMSLVASDYVELWIQHNEGGTQSTNATYTHLSAYKLLGV